MASSNAVLLATTSLAAVVLATLWFIKRKRVDLTEWTRLTLIEKHAINHNCNLYRFALPHPDAQLNLPLGRHLQVRGPEGAVRSYTPTNAQPGYFELIVKTYPQGKVSSHLASLEVGDGIEFRGPRGDYEHQSNLRLGMIAGGTGITPMLQVIRGILADPHDRSHVDLIFANVTEADIILRDELDALPADRVRVFHVLNEPPKNKKTWMGGKGFVSAEHIKLHFERVDRVLLCGPPPMVKGMQEHLASLGYEKDKIYKF